MVSSALLAATLGATSAEAQSRSTSAAAAAAAAASTNTIEELVVTAEKRAQSLQDVPVAISAFTSEKRDLVGINTIADMTNFTPGLEYNASNDRNTLRGIGRLTNVHAADISVAQYSDGIYTSSTVEAGKTPLFTDRVEVLRGPQGTLYGRNSIGGAINIISKRPSDEPYAEVRAQYQNFDHYIIEAAASGPTPVPGLEVRLAANWEKQNEGWFHNVLPGQHDEGGIIDQTYLEGQVKWKFNDRFDMWAKIATAHWANDGGGPGQRTGYTIVQGNPAFASYQTNSPGFFINAGYACFANTGVSNVSTVGGISLAQACTNPNSKNVRDYSSTIQASAKLTGVVIFSSEWNAHFDGFDLKYLAGGTKYNYQAILPADSPGITAFTLPNFIGAPGARVLPREGSYYREDLTWFSHELNLASTKEGPLQWIVGAYYYDESYLQPTAGVLFDQTLNGPFLTNATCPFTTLCPSTQAMRPNSFYDDRPEIKTTSAAAYGQIDWKFATDWKMTLGLRYTDDRKQGSEDGRLLCLSVTTCTASAGNPAPFQTGFPPEIIGNYLVDLTQIPVVVTAGVLPGTPGAPGTASGKGVSSFTTFDPATGFAHRTLDDHWSATTGTAGVQWEPDRDTMAYFRYSRGYKAGGFNVAVGSFFNPNVETNPEHVNAYEVGLKKNFGRTIQTNLAVFYYDYSNYQAPISVVPTGGGVGVAQGVFFNIPKSVSQGVELETTWQPIDHLQVLFNYSYLDAHISEATGVVDPADPTAVQPGARPSGPGGSCAANPGGSCDVFTGQVQRGQNLSGNSLPNAPKNKVALNVNYTWELDTGNLTGGVTFVWRDKQYGSLFDRPYYEAPSWDQVDLRLVYKDKANKYTVIGFVKNVADSLGYEAGTTAGRRAGFVPAYTLGGLAAGFGPAPVVQGIASTYTLTPPRTYGVELQYRFF
jgi:iron complex outermembrane receptor protein